MVRTRAAVVLLVSACALTLAACGSSGGEPTRTSAAPSASAPPSSASASPSPSPSAFTRSCDDALSLVDVSKAAGAPIIGDTAFVVGEPDSSIGRVAYLNCRYGLPAGADSSSTDPAAPSPSPTATTAAVPAVEIGVSRYATAAQATKRVEGTVSEYRSTGAKATDVEVGSSRGTLLETPGQPRTLVVASGTQTVAVTMVDAVYTGQQQIAAVAALGLAVR